MNSIFKLMTLVVVIGFLSGCQGLDARNPLVTGSNSQDKVITVGMVAELMARSYGANHDGLTQAKSLQRLKDFGVWPDGDDTISDVCTHRTLQSVLAIMKKKGVSNAQRDGTLQRASKVTIRIYDVGVNKEDNIDLETVVDKGGFVTLPFLRKVRISGMTASEAQVVIREAYIKGGFFKNLTVDVTGAAGSLYITGEVNTPGRLDFEGNMTLSDLIITSGELTEFANRSNIKLIRDKNVTAHDYSDILEGKAFDPVLRPGDRVTVSRRMF